MADVLNRVHLHLVWAVWAVWDRRPLLTPPVQQVVYPAIIAAGREHRCLVKADFVS